MTAVQTLAPPRGLATPDGASDLAFLGLEQRALLDKVRACSHLHHLAALERIAGAKLLAASGQYLVEGRAVYRQLLGAAWSAAERERELDRLAARLELGLPRGYRWAGGCEHLVTRSDVSTAWPFLALIACLDAGHAHANVLAATIGDWIEELDPVELAPAWSTRTLVARRPIVMSQWGNAHAALTGWDLEHAVFDLISLIAAVWDALKEQAAADIEFVAVHCNGIGVADVQRLKSSAFAMCWQQSVAPALGAPASRAAVGRLTTPLQLQRIQSWMTRHRPPSNPFDLSLTPRNPTMKQRPATVDTRRYQKCIDASKRVRWDIERDVIRGRKFDFGDRFLPNGLSKVDEIGGLSRTEQRLLSQIQGRTYANLFALVERFINIKVLELTRSHWFDDQIALEALVRFSDEELKHQELFRRIEALIAEGMPAGYRCVADPNAVARLVLGKGTWAVLALTCHIELYTQAHYRQSIDGDESVSELFKDVFLYHWKEESQHTILDEMEWLQEDARLSNEQRDQAVGELIELVLAIDDILVQQSAADTAYFAKACGRALNADERRDLASGVLAAYRWQYVTSGFQEPRFSRLLSGLLDGEQLGRLYAAVAPIVSLPAHG
jgi:hypothetical protein